MGKFADNLNLGKRVLPLWGVEGSAPLCKKIRVCRAKNA